MAQSNKKKDADEGIKVICRNKRALHEYNLFDTMECGLVLTGTEVKSLRDGIASLEDAYARIMDGEIWLIGSDIPEYAMGNRLNHKPKRTAQAAHAPPRDRQVRRQSLGTWLHAGAAQAVFQGRAGQSGAGRRTRQAIPRQAPGPENCGSTARDSAGDERQALVSIMSKTGNNLPTGGLPTEE